jgi:hypothetical protein
MILLTIIGIFICPVFTLGCVLIHFNHSGLGILAIIVSLFFSDKEEETIEKKINTNIEINEK